MSNIRNIPFTEIVERVDSLGRSNVHTKQRTRAVVNDVYTHDIQREYDWPHLKASSAISTIAEYTTGVVSVTTQDSVCTFASGAVITSAMTGRKIKFNTNADVYDFTFSDSTGGTISPSLSGVSNVTISGYTIFQPYVTLPVDFDRFPVNGGLLFYESGQPQPLPELVDDDYYAEANASPTSSPDYCRPYDYDTAGCLRYEIIPPPSQVYILQDEYLKFLAPMYETTAGTIVMDSAATIISGTDSLFTQAQTGDYIRADAFGTKQDSTWYKITAVTNDTTLTISPAFRSDSSYTGSYTICSVPKMPYRLQDAVIYGSLKKILSDHKDPMLALAHAEYARIITDNKALYQSRHAKDDVELLAEDYEYRR